jgi:hypothetical protein
VITIKTQRLAFQGYLSNKLHWLSGLTTQRPLRRVDPDRLTAEAIILGCLTPPSICPSENCRLRTGSSLRRTTAKLESRPRKSPAYGKPERAKQDSLGGYSAPFTACAFVDSPPGPSLAAHAASLCPRLTCWPLFGGGAQRVHEIGQRCEGSSGNPIARAPAG